MGQRPEKESWELAAEELVRRVRNLLDDHGDAIELALRESLGRDEARSQIYQLDLMVRVLELELWRKRTTPSGDVVGWLANGVKVALATVGLTLTTLATTQAYDALRGTEEQAQRVVECVIKERRAAASEGQTVRTPRPLVFPRRDAEPWLFDDSGTLFPPPSLEPLRRFLLTRDMPREVVDSMPNALLEAAAQAHVAASGTHAGLVHYLGLLRLHTAAGTFTDGSG